MGTHKVRISLLSVTMQQTAKIKARNLNKALHCILQTQDSAGTNNGSSLAALLTPSSSWSAKEQILLAKCTPPAEEVYIMRVLHSCLQ